MATLIMNYHCRLPLPLVALTTLLLAIPVATAQSILLTADDFVLLGGTAVTVGGAGPNTYSNGNVGSAASISGFPPATIVNGETILGGPIVGQALIDLGSARDKLNALVVDPANNLTGQDLGGKTLTPGVYKFDVAAEITLAGTKILTLDAQGKNNVVWVINIGTTLTTAAGAQVQFINLGTNGGADNGLFWNAGTSITFGAGNVIAGNYLAAENITFGTTVPADGAGSGRALAHAIVSFDGEGTMDALGGPGAGDMTGGLALDENGDIVSSGYVLLSANGVYTQGDSSVILNPGVIFNTPGITIDGIVADGVDGDLQPVPSSLTIFQTIATLTGANTYTGGTVVDSGTLTTGSANLPANGNVSLIDSNETNTFGALIFSQSTDGTFGGIISGGGSVTKEDTGVLTLTGANTYTGGTFVNGGTLVASGASLPVDGTVALDNDSSLAFDQSTDGSFGGVISGAGSVTKDGSAVLTLTAVNTYTGGTTVNTGTLALSGAGTLGANTGTLAVNEATLDLGETTQTVGAVTLNGGSITNGTLNGSSYTSTGGSVAAVLTGSAVSFTNTSGTTTLTGANTYTGGTVINGGTVISNTASLPVDRPVSTAVGSSLVLDQATDGSFGGVISGAGSVTKEGPAMVTFTAVNTHTGGTTVNEGTLAVSGTGTLGGTTGALTVNEASLDLGGTSQTVGAVSLNGGSIDNGTLNGASYTSTGGSIAAIITGEGVVFTNTAGVTTLTGANTYNGGTVITGGSIVTNSASLPSAQNMTLGPDGRLVLEQPVDTNFNGMVSGTGTIEKRGAGALTMTNDTTASIDIQGGSFILTDTMVGSTNVASGTFLRGNGTINGDLFNGGTVSPGFSPGTIIVVGNYTQTAGGTFVVEIASAISYDQLIVGGSASLDGTLQVDLLGGYNPAGQSFDIITAAGGVAGTFSAVTGSAALDAVVTYNANDVTVSFTQTPFADFAGTPNQVAVANAALLTPAITTALNGVPTAAEMPAALNALSPQGYQIWSDIAFARSLSLSERLARDSRAIPGHDDFYFQVGQSRNRTDGDLDVGAASFSSDSGLVGGDHAFGDNLVVGGFFDYTETDAGLGSAGSTTNVKSKMPGIRATWRKNVWFVNAAIAYGFDDYESTRNIAFTGTSAVAKSSTDGRQWLMNLSGGRHFNAGPVTLSPFGGLLASGWKSDGFTETGAGAFNNTVGDQSAHSLRTQLGLEASFLLNVGSVSLSPHLRAAWIHELTNDARPMNASFGGTPYAITTRRPTRDSARLSAGFDAKLSERVSLYADYGVQTGDTTRVVGEWSAGLSMRF